MSAVSMTQRRRHADSFDVDVVLIAGYWAIGASGAVGTKTGATGVKLTRTGAGLYTLQLQGADTSLDARVPYILHCNAKVVVNDSDPTNDTDAMDARELTRDATTGTITIACFDEGGVVRDPASGASLSVLLAVKLSNVTR